MISALINRQLMECPCTCAGYYLTGDNARRDKDGYYWITGRADDVVIVSGAYERKTCLRLEDAEMMYK